MKQPKLVLRESAVYDASRGWQPGYFVEMGAGTGHMAQLFAARGFSGVCHDLSIGSRAIMRGNFKENSVTLGVVDDVAELPSESFEYLFAFEVLEHIEDDLQTLRDWLRVLRTGGRLLISVPAHARKFGRSDELVGHVRRYERKQVRSLLESAGIGDVRIINYGYPITELTRRLSNRMVRDDHSYDELTPVERSMRSAQAKPKVIDRALQIIGGNAVLPFCVIQRWFYRFDLGDGVIAGGVKLGSPPMPGVAAQAAQ